jgi:hypothetical protein
LGRKNYFKQLEEKDDQREEEDIQQEDLLFASPIYTTGGVTTGRDLTPRRAVQGHG